MTKFKVGDRVRVTEAYKCNYPSNEGIYVGTEFEITEVKDPNCFKYPYRAKQLSEGHGSEGKGMLFLEDELELKDDRFPVGTRVRCTMTGSSFKDREGTVTRLIFQSNRYHEVTWDGDINPGGGLWSKSALELIEDQPEQEPEVNSRIELLEKTLRELLWVFIYYRDQHINKGAYDDVYKAMFNEMIADRIDNVLNAD